MWCAARFDIRAVIFYINDLPNALRVAELLLFADDTTIYYYHKDPISLINVLNDKLRNVDCWMKANKLSVNISKTNYVIFKLRNKKFHINTPLTFDGNPITQRKALKFLGIDIDENLTWKTHISNVCKKISKSVGIIFRSRFYLSKKSKISLYSTLVYPYLTYCNTVWSSTYKNNLSRIFLLQKRIVRIMTNSEIRAHTAPLFTELKILDIYNLNAFYIAKFMFVYHNNSLPPSFYNLFVTSHEIHDYNTRNASSYRSHACKTNVKQFTILYQGPKI